VAGEERGSCAFYTENVQRLFCEEKDKRIEETKRVEEVESDRYGKGL